eukprot:Lithocolla_globosa_v1_NODE_1039_length_2923_cov_6.165969.p4 type:complete len:107 gc:universal NODE_1039_length_2923_cov_6.165969:601-921(+)
MLLLLLLLLLFLLFGVFYSCHLFKSFLDGHGWSINPFNLFFKIFIGLKQVVPELVLRSSCRRDAFGVFYSHQLVMRPSLRAKVIRDNSTNPIATVGFRNLFVFLVA